MLFAAQIIVAIGLDLVLGDPPWFPHPVKLIGRVCNRFEQAARNRAGLIGLRGWGVITFWGVLTISAGAVWLLLFILGKIHPLTAAGGSIMILYFCIAVGDLIRHSRRVYEHLAGNDIQAAREAVAMLVGRDTEQLDQAGVARAGIESVAENLVDGVTAPLFWAIAAGLVSHVVSCEPIMAAAIGAIGYKAVNTMDSMIGYKNDQYLDFGRFAARADDAANFLPARLSGLCVVGAAFLLGYDGRNSTKIFFRDRMNSSSPNSGHTEAAVAGALGIQLGGSTSYFGTLSEKPLIGGGLRQPVPSDILSSNRLILASTVLFLGVTLILYIVIMAVMT